MEDSVAEFDIEIFFGVLVEHLKLTGANSPIEIDSNLFALGLDSTDALNLLLDLEERYSITFPESLLTDNTFRTPRALIAAVVALSASRPAGERKVL